MWWYQLALFQRSVLFLDTLQERANNMLSDEQAGLVDDPVRVTGTAFAGKSTGIASDNPWMQFEQLVSQSIIMGLDQYRKARDHASERDFAALYGA